MAFFFIHRGPHLFSQSKLLCISEPNIWRIWYFAVDDRKWKKIKKHNLFFLLPLHFHNSNLAWHNFFPLKIFQTFYTVVIRPKSMSLRLGRILLWKMWNLWLGGEWVGGGRTLVMLFLWQDVNSVPSVPLWITGSQSSHTFIPTQISVLCTF